MLIVSTQCFPPDLGGIENLMYSLCACLYEKGHDISVFADAGSAREDREFDRACGFQIHRYSGLKPWRRRKKAWNIARLAGECNNSRLIADSWKSLEHLDTTRFTRTICLAHGSELPLKPGQAKFARIRHSLAKAAVIIANSQYTAGRVENYTGPDERIHVIHPGINPPIVPDRAPAGTVKDRIGDSSPILLSIARLEPRKGLDRVLRIMPQVLQRFPEALYVIAGEGSLHPGLTRLAHELRISEHVLFCGRLDEPLKSGYIECSDLFVLPGAESGNDVEGFGMVFLEAAIHGVPSITGRFGGAAEAVIHEQTGLVCEISSEKELADAVLTLLDNTPLRRRLGENARHRARHFLWNSRIRDYEDLLFT